MIGTITNPDLRFPCDVADVILKFIELGKGAYIDAGNLDMGKYLFKLEMPFGRYRPV